jgi:hypothetical protein
MANLAISQRYRKIDDGRAKLTTVFNGHIEFDRNKSDVVLENLELGFFRIYSMKV